jgi:nicotinamidase/pyrazinamidase
MMTVPGFFQPDKVGARFTPKLSAAIAAGQAAGLAPSEDDRRRTLLLLVDPQVDFIHSNGALSVPGAVEDTRRTIAWMVDHAGEITDVAVSLDSHLPLQIFYPTWWQDDAGGHPEPFTPIAAEEVDAGRWHPVFEHEWSNEYVHRLETQAKKQLMIWPYHTMLGTPGHAVNPSLAEAIAFHSAARQSEPTYIIKGLIPSTEFYSLLEPEVKVPNDPMGDLNREFLGKLMGYDRVYVAGQAKSHCVLETLNSVAREAGGATEELGRFRLLEDCTSSVTHPEVDFEAIAQAALAALEAGGLRRVTSSDPLD